MAPLRPRYGDARPRAPRCPPEASVSLFSSGLRSVLSEALRAAAQRHKTHRLPQPEPGHLRCTRLIALPEPGELDHHCSEPSIAGFSDPLLTLDPAAAVRSRGKTGV